MSLLHWDSMTMYFNLSSFFVPQPENVTIDMAELRLYRAEERPRQASSLSAVRLSHTYRHMPVVYDLLIVCLSFQSLTVDKYWQSIAVEVFQLVDLFPV